MHSGVVPCSRRQALLRDTVLPVLNSSKAKGTSIDPNHGQTVTGIKGDIRQICHLAAVFEPPSGPKHTWYGNFDVGPFRACFSALHRPPSRMCVAP